MSQQFLEGIRGITEERIRKLLADLDKWAAESFPPNSPLALDGSRGWTATQIVEEIKKRLEGPENGWLDDFITESFLSFLNKKTG